MKITLNQAYRLLEDCSAVIWADYFLTFPALQDEDNEPKMFLSLDSTDEHGKVFLVEFYRQDNQEVKAIGNSLFLTDTTGEEIQLTLLHAMNTEIYLDGKPD